MDRASQFIKAGLITGILFGSLAGLQYLRILNVCTCCSMTALCGFVAAYLCSSASKHAGTGFDAGSGALAGLVAGAVFGVSTTVVGGIFVAAFGNPDMIGIFEWMQDLEDLPPTSVEQIDTMLYQITEEQAFSVIGLMLRLFFNVVLGAVWSTVGGLIGGAVFKTGPPPTPPPTSSPLPPTPSGP